MPYDKSSNEETSGINQYIAAFVVSIMVFCHGCEVGWVSPVISLLTDPKETPLDEPLTPSQVSLIGSLMCVTGFLATPVFGWTSDRYGRKTTGLMAAVPYIANWLLKLLGRSATTIMAARLLAGAGGAAIYAMSSTYLVEVATPKTRGALGSLLLFSLNLGIVTMYVMGACLGYSTVLVIMLALPTSYAVLMWRMPETPVFLIKNGRDKEAIKAIAWLRRVPEDHPVVRNEMAALKFDIQLISTSSQAVDHENDENAESGSTGSGVASSWRYLFLVPSTLKAFLVCFVLLTIQSFVGIFAVLTYANWIFEQAGSELSASVNSIIVGCLQFFGSVIASSMIERSGRKILLIGSCSCTALCMLVIGIYFYLSNFGYDVSSIGWVPVIAMSVVVSAFAMGLGPIPYILPNEMIPVQARALANVIGLSWVWLAAFLVSQFFNFFVELLGLYTVFWGFACSATCGILVTILFLPETKGEKLENIIAYYKGERVVKRRVDLGGQLL